MQTAMQAATNKIIIAQEDYETLNGYVKGSQYANTFDRRNITALNDELKKATLVKKEELPHDVVRLNSKVTVKEGGKNKLIELTVVLPEKADIKQKRVSVFAPVGTALLGFRQGQNVQWTVPAGQKTFTIMQVYNQNE